MLIMVIGLVLFLGIHSIRIVAESQRSALLERLGDNGYKGLYTIVSLLGFVLICWGYALARPESSHLWIPPAPTRWIAVFGALIAFIFLAASSVPGNRIKAAVKHPMVIGVMIWAAAHLSANGRLAEVVLFGAFGIWALFSYLAARARDKVSADEKIVPSAAADLKVLGGGLVVWLLFGLLLHRWLIGVPAFAPA